MGEQEDSSDPPPVPPVASPSQQQQWVQTTDAGQSTKAPEGCGSASEAVRRRPLTAGASTKRKRADGDGRHLCLAAF